MKEQDKNAGTFHPELPPPGAAEIARGASRALADLGYRVVAELPLGNGRRADLVGLDRRGGIVLAEIKSCVADFRADGKWHEYVPFCDLFLFAVNERFPLDVLPETPGILVADAFHGILVRPGTPTPLRAARRKAVILRFARTAAARLELIVDARRPEALARAR